LLKIIAEPSRPLEKTEKYVETVKPIKKNQLLDLITVKKKRIHHF
jgi:hypothetical protein